MSEVASWTCTCGRSLGSDRSKCPSCGASRAEGEVRVPVPSATPRPDPATWKNPLRPIAPSEPGSPPFVYVTDHHTLSMPGPCVCCLGGTNRFLDVILLDRKTQATGGLFRLVLGLLAHSDRSWHRRGQHPPGEDVVEIVFRVPICEPCRRHSEGSSLSVMAGLGAGVAAGILGLELSRDRPGRAGALAVTAAVVVFLLVRLLTTARRGPSCVGARPITARWEGERYRLEIAQRGWGERLEELNRPRT